MALLALVALAAACTTEREPVGPPQLPKDFQGSLLPASPLKAYGYVSQENGTSLAGEFLRLKEPVEFQRGSLWAESVTQDQLWQYGLGLAMGSIGRAQEVEASLVADKDFWFLRRDDRIYVVRGSGAGAAALRDDIASDRWVLLEKKYPDTWRIMQRLPGSPPTPIAAAGFFRNEKAIYEQIVEVTGLASFGELGETLLSIKAQDVVFGAYSQKALLVSTTMPLSFLKEAQVSTLLIARAGVSALSLRDVLKDAIKKAGLQQMKLDSETVYYTSRDELHVMVGNLGTVVYVALATDKSAAGDLLLSALKAK